MSDPPPEKTALPDSEPPEEETYIPAPPPDGGSLAWRAVLAGHLTTFNTWGYSNSFGIFQEYYATHLSLSPSTISWIGSIQIFLLYLTSTVSGQALDRGLFHHTMALGLSLQVTTMLGSSFCTTYPTLFLTQGVLQGLASGLVFCPVVGLISTYFARRRAFAVSASAAGGAVGGVVFPAIARQLLPKVGFGWTLRVMALVVMTNSVAILMLARPRRLPRRVGGVVELQAFKEAPYALFTVGSFFAFASVYCAFYYIRVFAKSKIGVSETTSFNILLIMNGVGFIARLIAALLADKVTGPVNMYVLTTFTASLALFAWVFVSTFNGMVAFVIIYGFLGGAVQSIFPSSLPSLTEDLSKVGTRIGMVFTVVSIASLTGPPLTGALIQKDHGGYLYAQLFGGCSMLLGSAFIAAARVAKQGTRMCDFV